jgi:hypothetical protein
MMPRLEKMNSLLTSIKKVDGETEKILEKINVAQSENKSHIEENKKVETQVQEKETELDTLKKTFEDKSVGLEDQVKALEEKVKEKEKEKALFYQNKELREKIKLLEKTNATLTQTIKDMKENKKTDSSTDTPEKMLEDFQRDIKVQYNGKNLKETTIAAIIDATIKFFKQDFIKFTQKERKERRKYLDSFEKYVEKSLELMEEIDNEIDKAQLRILNKLSITFDSFKDSLEYYLENQNEDILMMVMMLPQRLKMQMPSNKKLTKDVLKQVIRYQQNLIPKEYQNLAKLQRFQGQIPPERIALIFANKLSDSVFGKYEVEEEDLIACVQDPTLMNDLEMMNLMMSFQNSLQMMAPPGMGGPGGPDDFGGPMGPGGMPPGMMGGPGGFF